MIVFAIAAAIATGSATTLSQPIESFVQAPGPQAPLKGTMLMPRPDAPVVLIIPGSGPTDRDGNNPLGVTAAPYRLLAEALALRGIGTVRIDKRGMFASAPAIPDANHVTIGDYATDVASWTEVLRRTTGHSCIWVLGHSEGGLVALVAGQKNDGVCGLVLVAAPGRRLGSILREQLKANPANAPILPPAMAAIDALERGKPVDVSALHPALQQVFDPAVQGFLIDMLARDPATLIATLQHPVLIVQGERDLQVGVGDAERLKHAAPGAKLAVLPDVNHVLKAVTSDDRSANLATYADPGLPLAPGVADAVADFVAAHSGG